MTLIDLLPTSPYGRQGQQPEQLPGTNQGSTLHFTSSVNNIPQIQQPITNLGLGAQQQPKYLDTPPQ